MLKIKRVMSWERRRPQSTASSKQNDTGAVTGATQHRSCDDRLDASNQQQGTCHRCRVPKAGLCSPERRPLRRRGMQPQGSRRFVLPPPPPAGPTTLREWKRNCVENWFSVELTVCLVDFFDFDGDRFVSFTMLVGIVNFHNRSESLKAPYIVV